MSMLCMKELKVIISKDPYRYRLINSVCKSLRWLMWRLENTGRAFLHQTHLEKHMYVVAMILI